MGASKLIGRCMRAPLRALTRARDLYVRSLTSCAGRMHGAAALALAYPAAPVPASTGFTFGSGRLSTSTDDDHRELIRAASAARRDDEGWSPRETAAALPPAVRKSQSVVIGRIDEDKPCNVFDDGVVVGSDVLLSRRSRSCAAGGRRRGRPFV